MRRRPATRALTLITNEAFDLRGTTAVTATCDAANIGSTAVLTSSGFTLIRAFDGDIFAHAEIGRVHVDEWTSPIMA